MTELALVTEVSVVAVIPPESPVAIAAVITARDPGRRLAGEMQEETDALKNRTAAFPYSWSTATP